MRSGATALLLAMMAISSATVASFQIPQQSRTTETSLSAVSNRRDWMAGASIAAAASLFLPMSPANADADVSLLVAEEMKSFIDPQGLFALMVPKSFYTLRRTQKGDLPDAKTGKGRRGSSIFTAGNMAKAEVIAVERYVLTCSCCIVLCDLCCIPGIGSNEFTLQFLYSFPTSVLLEENGIEASGDLSSFPKIGDPTAVANLVILRREKDTGSKGAKVLDQVAISSDGKTLSFRLKTEIDVQKPELLMEEFGISQLFRVTLAKATLNSEDGNILAVFASALEQDFDNGVDGPALQQSVDSFIAIKQ
jgi:hypothetical protein